MPVVLLLSWSGAQLSMRVTSQFIVTLLRNVMVITRLATCFHADILLGLFDPEDGGDIFLRNVG
jgi:hypothetical protein